MTFNNINFYNRKTGNIAIKSWDEYGVGEDHTAEVIAKNLIRISSDGIRSPLKPGYIAVFQYEGRSSPAIVSHQSSNIHLTNLTQYHAAGIANLFEGTTNIYIDSLQIVSRPGSGRFFTAHHDAIHFVECRGDIHIKGCKTEFIGDDDVNIHGIYRPVINKNGNRQLNVKLMHFQQMGVKTLFAGDEVGFHDAKTLAYLGKSKLSKVIHRTAQETQLFFEADLPELDWQNIVVTLRDHNIDVQISGNHFSKHRARGLLIKTLKKVRIHDNYFSIQGVAIKLSNYASGCYEAGPVEDVEIYNNVFDQCNTEGFSQATFEISPAIIDQNSPVPIFKNGILFSENIMLTEEYHNDFLGGVTVLMGKAFTKKEKEDFVKNNVISAVNGIT